MNADILAILDSLGPRPTMAKIIVAASKCDHFTSQTNSVAFSILRNITLEPGLTAALKVQSAQRGFSALVRLGEFGAVQQPAFDSTSFLYTEVTDIIVVALHLQTLAPRLVLDFAALSNFEIDSLVTETLDTVVAVVAAIRRQSAALILVHNFELPRSAAFGIVEPIMANGQLNSIRALNLELMNRLAGIKSCYIIDIEYLLALHGYEAALDNRYWHIARAPYTFSFIERLAGEYVKFGAVLRAKNKKCLVLDCDNTLWGGVVGEDGLDGIALGETHPGSAFVEFQSALLGLYNRGVLLAINSKNNYEDVMQVFEEHPNSLLKPQHFVSTKINWNDKATNLREISADLNIGLDSLVFVDDSPFECQLVRTNVPEVVVVELPPDVTRYRDLLYAEGLFDTLIISDEDRRRSDMYRSEARRAELKASIGSMSEYLVSLNMRLTIANATAFSIPRIAQLTQKTNQFNLTARRYTEDDIGRMLSEKNWFVYFAELEDKFDKAGIIAVALVLDSDGVSRLDTFLMSCRVISRGVEHALLAHIAHESKERGSSILCGEYLPTPKNSLVKDFLGNAGFRGRLDSDGRLWDLLLTAPLPTMPEWFTEVRTTVPRAL